MASRWMRQVHRWASLVFMGVVSALFTALGIGREPASWAYFLPLIPLALLMLTGLYMFCLPYAARWRSDRRLGRESGAARPQAGRAG